MGKIGKKVKYRLLSFGIIPFLAAAAFLIIFFGQAHYFNELERVKGHAEKELLSIGRLKIREIAAWYRERLDDGAYIKSDPILAGHLKDLMEEQAPEERDKVIEWMASVKEDLGYMGVLLVDRDLKKVVSVPEEEDFTHIGRKMLQEAFFTGEVVFSDLHKYGGEGYVHLDMVVPLKAPGKTEIIGGLFFRIDPWKVLFPFLDEWPTTSASGENMLVSLRDGHVLYLNGTKFSKDIPPLGTSSQGEEIIISAMGSGRSGVVVEGEDYRGERVLAGVYSIPGTSWYFVCKKDLKEIYFPVSGELRWIILFMFLLAVSILSMLAVTVQTARIRIKRNEYESRIKGLVLEKQYNLLSKYANDAIILINEDLTILQANDRAAGCYGYPVSKLVGMTLWSLRAPEERAKIRTQFEKIDTLAGATYETKHLKKDGTVFPVEISTRMIDIEGEKFYQSIIRDISGQKSAERIIREREKDLKTLLEAANSVIIRWRPDGTIIFINDLGRRKFGYEKGELEGKNVMTLVPRVDSAGRDIGDLAAKIAADPERYEFVDNENIGKNGERLWLSWSNKAINYDDGRLKEMLSIGNDITERRKAEEALRMSIAEWDATFNASHDSIMLIGKDRRVMKANLAASKMLDRATGNVVGKHCNELMSVLGVGPEFFPIKKVLESRKSEVAEISVRGRENIWVEILVDPVFDGSGEISSFVHTVKDITEKKKDEEELFNLAEVVKHSAELVILAACDGRIMFINDAGAEMLGIDPLDPGKSKIMDFIPDDLKAKVRREIFLP
ncbi:MAG: PAS domain S-box protein, partial [Candidatus Omnitrophica bacterium]|nr:PAS domain S-box protein [Candidatus Omnitrophota bacterium]